MKRIKYNLKVTKINWQTDGYKVELPYEVIFEDFNIDLFNELKIDGLDNDEFVTDLLSDNFDWLVNSCSYKVIKTKEETDISYLDSVSRIVYKEKMFKTI